MQNVITNQKEMMTSDKVKRTDKELILLMLDNIDTHLTSGLCFMNYGLRITGIINLAEFKRIDHLLMMYLPDRNYYGYSWDVGVKKPRIEFLKQLIEVL